MLIRRHALALPALALLTRPALAAWPERPIRVVVPYAAGGNIDVVSRLLAPALTERLGQPVVVDNRPGAGGSLGAEQVARAAADGYTLLAGSNGPITVNPLVQARLPYDPLRDLVPIALVNAVPLVLIAGGANPPATLAAAVAESRAKPGGFTVGTPGAGSTAHLALELFNNASGAALMHVPYRGGGAVVPDLIAGNIRAMFVELSTALPLHKEGKGRILAVASRARVPQLPEVPTFTEAGVKDFTAASYCGLLAPRGTPGAVLSGVRDAVAAATADAAIRVKLEGMGSEVASGAEQTPDGFLAFLRRQAEDARRAADIAGLKPE
ncbi:Bug family tripartite tricarboxylate transporter substrate binding protein [Pararoseomonas indoligenes]|uniref:Tripartite tricarboxylate transporter substrate binding protein n=1 Tax=Roseomonas indoligenes TaxID=2820811 RepID=A0A940MX14_9PROT|nr:tripartite tricarboxylate transporter substrate binding protein [Pararoseomonas indoligenes]MBP0492570.1 tripartite tricarboxylate transporter substrate binding protein [Pararoseomonas indoligenes]